MRESVFTEALQTAIVLRDLEVPCGPTSTPSAGKTPRAEPSWPGDPERRADLNAFRARHRGGESRYEFLRA